MKPEVLHNLLVAHYERMPNFDDYSVTSREHLTWISQAHALVNRWDKLEAMSLKSSADFLSMPITREKNIGTILGVLNRAIADLELDLPKDSQSTFGVGDVYDIFKKLNEVISSAEKSIFIIDPYLDSSVFDHYLNSRSENVSVRLLLSKKADELKPSAEKYKEQHGDVLEIRKTKKIHDRVIFIDGYACWVLGQSLKDAAKAKPTYLSPLAPDVVCAKFRDYDEIWNKANQI